MDETMTAATFDARLSRAQSAVEARLAHWLKQDRDGPDRYHDALRHAVLGGGKRVRPFLVLETAALFDANATAALDVASALECVHCYSLVHDDLPAMDNDETRRGRPTVWKAFDEWTAILAGDGLLTLAFEILGALDGVEPQAQIRLVRELARASGSAGMVGGQAFDLLADKRREPAVPDLAHIRRLQAMKTGALIRFACIAGPILAGCPERDVSTLGSFGDHLGVAFQIADDLLDVTGDATVVGKAVGKDVAAGKATLVSLLGLDAARSTLAETEAAAISALAPYGDKAAVLIETARFVAHRTA